MASKELTGSMEFGSLGFIPGMSPAMQTLESVVREIAATDIPVLLVGESGTGKEMFARRLHELSRSGEAPLVRIACASSSATTFPSDLGLAANGHGAAPEKMPGTVFFDEISELDAACQRILLYALPDGRLASRNGSASARVISTTSRNLDEEMHAGRFRSELYYRINGACLRLPPLRDRKDDIPLLAEYFLTKHATQFGRPRPAIGARTMRALLDHAWPGNIRELENAIKKIVVMGDESFVMAEIFPTRPEPQHAEPQDPRVHSLKAAAKAASREAERQMILEALARTRWNRKRAATELQISYKSLLHKLKQIGLPDSGTN